MVRGNHTHERSDITNWTHSHDEDTGWLDLTPYLENGWTYFSPWQLPQFRRKNGIVFVQGLLAPGTTAGGTRLFNIPEGFRKGGGTSHTPVATGAGGGLSGILNITESGDFLINTNCIGWVSLDNLSYPADN